MIDLNHTVVFSFLLILCCTQTVISTKCKHRQFVKLQYESSSVCFNAGRWQPKLVLGRIAVNRTAGNYIISRNCETLLIEAIRSRRPTICKKLLNSKYSTTRDSKGRSVLATAYGLGYFEILQALLSVSPANNESSPSRVDRKLKDPTLPYSNRDGSATSAVHEAAGRGYAGVVAVLLKFAAVNRAPHGNAVDYGALFGAWRKNNPASLMALLSVGKLRLEDFVPAEELLIDCILTWRRFAKAAVKLLEIGVNGKTTPYHTDPKIMFAVAQGAPPWFIEKLLTFAPDIDARGVSAVTALHWACLKNKTNLVKYLVSRGANIRAVTDFGWTPLHMCVVYGSLEAVDFLLENGAFIDARDQYQDTPLISPIDQGGKVSHEILALLLQKGAFVNATNVDGNSALILALFHKLPLATIKMLLAYGADLNGASNDKMTPLNAAVAANSSTDIVRLLLAQGARVNVSEELGRTPLMHAILNQNFDSLNLLLQAKANVNAQTIGDNGKTALHIVISNKLLPKIMEILIEHGADCDLAMNNGDTALILAVKLNQSKNVEILLKKGVDVRARNANGETAYSLATTTEMKEILIRYNASQDNDTATRQRVAEAGRVLPAVDDSDDEPMPGYPLKVVRSERIPSKPRKLALLLELSGLGSYNYSCIVNAAVKKLLDVINSQSHFAPGFSLELHYLDQDWQYGWSREEDVDLKRFLGRSVDFFTNPIYRRQNTSVIYFPMAIGPKLAWCASFENSLVRGNVLQTMRRVQDYFRVSSVYLDNCIKEEPIFRSPNENQIDSQDIAMLTLLSFVKTEKFGFSWKQIAVIGAEIQSPRIAVYLKWMTFNSLEAVAVHLSENVNINASLVAVGRGRARIILIVTQFEECAKCLEMLCLAYWAGIRPDRYVVLMQSPACLSCLVDNPPTSKCSTSIQRSQLTMVFVGLQKYLARTALSSNHMMKQIFFELWDSTLQARSLITVSGANGACPNSNWRALLIAMRTALYLVHLVVSKFQDLSLVDLRHEIHQAAVASLIAPADEDLRMGLVIQPNLDYSKADKNQWRQHVEWRTVASIRLTLLNEQRNGDPSFNLNFSTHNITPVQSIFWSTKNGQPPKDLSRVRQIDANSNRVATLVVIVATIVASVFQIGLAIVAVVRKASYQKEEVYFDFPNNFIVLISCLLLNLSNIALLMGSEYFSSEMCSLRLAFTVTGLTMVNSVLLAKMLAMPTFVYVNRYISRDYRKKVRFDVKGHEQLRRANMKRLESKITVFVAAVLLCVLVLLSVWLASDPIQLKSSVEYVEEPIFDVDLDTFVTYHISWCHSPSQIYLIGVFSALQAVLLIFSVVARLGVKQRLVRRRWKPEIVHVKMAVNNAATIVVFVSFLMVVVPARPVETWWFVKVLLFAVGQLIFSVSSFAILFFNMWSALLRTKSM